MHLAFDGDRKMATSMESNGSGLVGSGGGRGCTEARTYLVGTTTGDSLTGDDRKSLHSELDSSMRRRGRRPWPFVRLASDKDTCSRSFPRMGNPKVQSSRASQPYHALPSQHHLPACSPLYSTLQ